jgi:hypothetical protein
MLSAPLSAKSGTVTDLPLRLSTASRGVGPVVEIDIALVVEVAVSDNVNVNLRDWFHDLRELDPVTLPVADPERHQLCPELI